MTYRSTDLTEELRALVESSSLPPSALDLGEACARGRSARRRRRAAGVGGGVAGTCLAVALAVALLPGASPVAHPPAPAAGTAASPTGDPLATTITFGWLPDGLHFSGAIVGSDTGQDSVEASNGTTEFDVTALKAGERPPQTCGDVTIVPAGAYTPPPCYQKAPDVGGREAYWSLAPDDADAHFDGYVELDWEYAPNAWAYLDANVGSDTSNDIVATVYRVAEGVRFGNAKPIPLPFHLPAAPADMPNTGAIWVEAPTAARGPQPRNNWIGVQLTWAEPVSKTADSSALGFILTPSTSTFPTAAELKIGGNAVPAQGVKHITVDGHEALVLTATSDGEPDQALVVHDVGGGDFTLTAFNSLAIHELDAAGGIVAYYKSMQVLGMDRSDWTTDVIG
jgi:hypothetical protein